MQSDFGFTLELAGFSAMVVRAASQPPTPSLSLMTSIPWSYNGQSRPATPAGINVQNQYPLLSPCMAYGLNIPDDDRNVLIQYWPNMYGDNEAFWGHEYEKHGSCVHPFYLDQLTYFVIAHRVATSTDLYSILLAADFEVVFKTLA
ncbi:extracellular ribonuclease le [Quercus suber]|uniref:Extracellular ribonuclease le n=1 Tax=Quercus suber TaxID=58331 RepID=A0AAW0KMG9_QUESU